LRGPHEGDRDRPLVERASKSDNPQGICRGQIRLRRDARCASAAAARVIAALGTRVEGPCRPHDVDSAVVLHIVGRLGPHGSVRVCEDLQRAHIRQ
jgi:hypothetical protein